MPILGPFWHKNKLKTADLSFKINLTCHYVLFFIFYLDLHGDLEYLFCKQYNLNPEYYIFEL